MQVWCLEKDKKEMLDAKHNASTIQKASLLDFYIFGKAAEIMYPALRPQKVSSILRWKISAFAVVQHSSQQFLLDIAGRKRQQPCTNGSPTVDLKFE